VNTVDQDLELQVYLPDERVPDLQETDLAAEEPTSQSRSANRNRYNGRPAREERQPEESEPGFDLLEDLTPYELKTVCTSVASLEQPATLVEIFSSIRDLDERGELELSREEIGEVITAMLDADYLGKVRQRPYQQAKADMTFYALNTDKQEVKSALNSG